MAKAARKPKKHIHSVDIEQFKAADIAKAGSALTLAIRAYGSLIATVEIGQGTFGFKSAGTRSFKRVSWSDLETRLFPPKKN